MLSMKLVYLMRYWPVYGGGETVTRALVNELAARGNDVYVIYLWSRTGDMNTYTNPRVQEIHIQGLDEVHDGRILKSQYSRLRKLLNKTLREIKCDIIINQWLPTKLVRKAMNGCNAKMIKCHHGPIKFLPVITTVKQKIFYKIFGDKAGYIRVYPEFSKDYKYSDYWVLLSEGTKEDAIKLLPYSDINRLKVITNPLPYFIDDREIDFDNKKKEIIFVGRIVKFKRLYYLLDVWEKLQKRLPEWHLTIVGDGELLQQEIEHAKRMGLKEISFEGFQDSKPYLLQSQILAMTSSQEGFGMVLVEAQQCGCVPIAVDSFPTVHDIIQNNRNGILVEDHNIDAYADALYELATNHEKWMQLAIAGIEDSKKFNVEHICDQWEELFREIKAN